MGPELVGACVFCAGLLLGMDLAPRPGLTGEMGFSYATLARRFEFTEERTDGSDVTPKFILIGMGNARPATDGWGAGTPAFEWRARIAFAPSHDEQTRAAIGDNEGINMDGTGRYENFALLLRLPLGARDSVEIAANRRSEKATDIINIGGGNQEFTEERTLSAERVDLAAGWRHRWKGLEAEAAFRWTKPSGFNATALSFQNASGSLFGGDAEVRWKPGPWTVLAHGEWMGGSLDVHRESYPEFQDRDASISATFQAVRLSLGYSWPRTELMLSTTYDREALPFVALAVLGTETIAFDEGYDPSSVNEELFWDLAFRYSVSPAIRVRISVRLGWGDETLTLTDSAGIHPTRTLDVARRGIFGGSLSDPLGSPELAFYLGADFSIGTPGH